MNAIEVLAEHALKTLPDSIEQRKKVLAALSQVLTTKHPDKQAVEGMLAGLSAHDQAQTWLSFEKEKPNTEPPPQIYREADGAGN